MHWNIHNDSDWMAKDKLAVLLLTPLANNDLLTCLGIIKDYVYNYSIHRTDNLCMRVYMHVCYGTEFTGCFDPMERVCQSGRL